LYENVRSVQPQHRTIVHSHWSIICEHSIRIKPYESLHDECGCNARYCTLQTEIAGHEPRIRAVEESGQQMIDDGKYKSYFFLIQYALLYSIL
jgi:hypothetical protein